MPTKTTDARKLPMCAGCRNDFYNSNNPLGVKRCWSLATAKTVTRWRIGWWTQPTSRKAFTKVRTLDCHHAPGKYAHFESLPVHLTRRAVSARPPQDQEQR